MLARIPLWVPALLVFLLFVGHRQSKPRALRPAVVAAIGASMTALSLWGVVSAFGWVTAPLLGWGAGMLAAVGLSERLFALRGLQAVIDPEKGGAAKIAVPGSWLPLALMLGIFATKSALGVAAGIGAPVGGHSAAAAAAGLALGFFSGGFAARALAVHRFAHRQAVVGT